MEAKEKVRLKSLEPYRHLFPKAMVRDKTVKKGASVEDTVRIIPEIIKKTAWQVQKYVDHELKDLSTYDACKKLWGFVKYHIEYRPDERGIEQVRSPRRLIHDGYGDCDCGTTFILACLYVLKIPAIRRITKYNEDRFQHIYPVVPLKNGKEIIVDFVVHQFNYEEPYTEKKDYKMDLQFLDGIEDRDPTLLGVDAQDLYGGLNDIGELGQLLRKAKHRGGGIFKKRTPEQKKQKKAERRKKLLRFVNKANRFNAAAALLRAGVLASMKLNLLKVAEKLKWGYATREQAQKYGMDMSKYDKLKHILTKAEKVFYTAGGKPENLRKAILTGRGNRHHELSGMDGYSESTPINELLGAIYEDEFVNGLEGEGLGIATEAAIASATGAMTALAVLLKQVGVLFPKKDGEGKKSRRRNADSESGGDSGSDNGGGGGSDSSENSESDTSESSTPSEQSEESSPSENDSQNNSEPSEDESSDDNLPATVDDQTPATTSDEDSEDKSESSDDESANGLIGLGGIKDFYQKNKKWIVPVGIAATAITLGLVINHYASKPAAKLQPQPVQQSTTVNGTPRKRKRKRTSEKSSGKQSVIALM